MPQSANTVELPYEISLVYRQLRESERPSISEDRSTDAESAMNRRIALVIHQQINDYLRSGQWSFECPEGNDTCDIINYFPRHGLFSEVDNAIKPKTLPANNSTLPPSYASPLDQAVKYFYKKQLGLSIYRGLLKESRTIQTEIDKNLNDLKGVNKQLLTQSKDRQKQANTIANVFGSLQDLLFNPVSETAFSPMKLRHLDPQSRRETGCVSSFLLSCSKRAVW